MADKIRVGIVGAGAISGEYLKMAPLFPVMHIVALADLDPARSEARAAEFGIGRVLPVDHLLRDPAVDVVLNLTVPGAHARIALQAIEQGKHTFSEKPLGVNVDEGRNILEAARRKGVRVGCAPDTFMGAGIQTVRKLIDDGAIGRPVAFTAFMMGRGHESWHPNPEFYYQPGGGPMFDMGPYYLTALMNFFGPIKRIMGMASIAISQRTITSQPKHGTKISVQTPDHICGSIEFQNGVVGTLITTFATYFPPVDETQPITIFGEEGTLRAPDPNRFDGPVHLRSAGDADWKQMPLTFAQGLGRAVGLADMARGIQSGRPHRASGEQAFSVLEAMQAFLDSSSGGRAVSPTLPYHRPAPMPEHTGVLLD